MSWFFTVNLVLIWAALLVLFFICLTLLKRLGDMTQKGAPLMPSNFMETGSQLPNVVAQTPDGDIYASDVLFRSKTGFFFLDPNCEVCKYRIPLINQVFQRNRESELKVYAVISGTADEAMKYARSNGVNVPLLFGEAGSSSMIQVLDIDIYPSYYLLEPGGKVFASGIVNLEPAFENTVSRWAMERI